MPRPRDQWFADTFRVLPGVESLAQHPRLRPGEVLRRAGRNVAILRCPACNAIQFFCVEVDGPDDAPTFKRPVRCSAADCRDCGVWFTVLGGRAGPVEPPVERKPEAPAGVRGRIKPPPLVG